MTTNNLSDHTKVALCVACTLVPGPMAQCATCPFNVGYYVRKTHEALLKVPEGAERESFYATMPKALWEIYYSYLEGMEGKPGDYKQLKEAFQEACHNHA